MRKPEAQQTFFQYVRKNFNVDAGLNPIGDNYVRNTIVIEELLIFDDDTVTMPYYDTLTNKTFEYPTIRAIARVPIRLFFMRSFLGQEPVIRVHVDVSSKDFL